MTVIADPFKQIVFRADILVVLGVDKELLLAFLILKADLIKATTVRGTHGLEGALCFFIRQCVWRHVVAVIHLAGDERSIRITFNKIDNHFMANAGQKHGSPAVSGHGLADPDPAGAVFISFSLTIPVKLNLYTSVFIGIDLFPGRADHDSRLGASHYGFCGITRRAIWNIKWNTFKMIDIRRFRPHALYRSPGIIRDLAHFMLNMG